MLLEYISQKFNQTVTQSPVGLSTFSLVPTLTEGKHKHQLVLTGFNTTHLRSVLYKEYGVAGSERLWDVLTWRSMSFNRWFVPEIIYMLSELQKKRVGPTGVIAKVLKLLIEESWYKDTVGPIKPVLDRKRIESTLKWKPLDVQNRFLDKFDQAVGNFKLRGALGALAAGSGKTFTSLCVAEGLHAELVIVICPKPTLVDPWKNSINTLFKSPQTSWVSEVVTDRTVQEITTKTRFVVVHYEQIDKVLSRVYHLHADTKRTLIILDESHNLNDIKSNRTKKYLNAITQFSPFVVALSGTPIKANGLEVIPMLTAIDPMFNESAQRAFTKYSKSLRGSGYEVLTRRINMFSLISEKKELGLKPYEVKTITLTLKDGKDFTLSVVSEKMKRYAKKALVKYEALQPTALEFYMKLFERFLKHPEYDAAKDALTLILKSKSYMHLHVEMATVSRFERDVMLPNLSAAETKEFKATKATAKYPKLKVLGETLGVVLTKERIRCNAALAEAIDYQAIMDSAEGKVIAFSNNVTVAISGAYTVNQSTPIVITGETSRDLPGDVKRFYDEPALNPLFTTYASLSTGVPITIASDVIIIDSPYREYTLTQAISRAHRLGNDKQVVVWYVELNTGEESNLNSRQLDIAKWSSGEVSDILGITAATEFPAEVVNELA